MRSRGSGTKRTAATAPPDAVRQVDLDAQRQPLELGEAGHHRLGPRRLVGQQRQIARRREIADRVAFVGREVFRRAAHGDVAAGAVEARQVDALVNVLAVVPFVEIALVARLHLVEDDQHSLAVQGHGHFLFSNSPSYDNCADATGALTALPALRRGAVFRPFCRCERIILRVRRGMPLDRPEQCCGVCGNASRPRERKHHENRQDRGSSLQRRLARLLVPQDHDRRRPCRLVGIQRGLRQRRPHRRDPPHGAGPDRPRSAADRAHHDAPVRHHAPGAGRPEPAGDGRHRERAARRQGQGAGRSGLRAVRRAGARSPAALLVALRHLPLPQRRGDGRRAGALARRSGEARQAREGARLQGAEDQHLPLRSGPAQHAPAGLRARRRAIPSSTPTARRWRRSPTDWRRSARAPARHGHPARHATSTSKPRATSRSRAPASPTICSGWRSIPTIPRACA